MAVITLPRKLDMTKEQAFDIFSKHFGSKYEVVPCREFNRDFAVQKNGFVAVGVKLEQSAGMTKFVYSGYAPSFIGRMTATRAGRLVFMLFWNGLTAEVRSFIETSPELR